MALKTPYSVMRFLSTQKETLQGNNCKAMTQIMKSVAVYWSVRRKRKQFKPNTAFEVRVPYLNAISMPQNKDVFTFYSTRLEIIMTRAKEWTKSPISGLELLSNLPAVTASL